MKSNTNNINKNYKRQHSPKPRTTTMSERILNACSISELQALRKEVENTAYTDQDSEMFLGMIDDQLENFK